MLLLAGLLPKDTFNRRLMMVFLVLWAVSCINVADPKYFAMQHVPTVLAVVSLTMAERKQLIDRLGFSLITGFLLLHLLGARYLYSDVPYDAWSQQIFGVSITDCFGFERNHYDRLVHFCFGLLFVYPLWQFFERQLSLRGRWSAVLAICVVMAVSAVYEIGEWVTALTFAPDWADAYNGQQGDAWDAQRDMSLAGVGAIVAASLFGVFKKPDARNH